MAYNFDTLFDRRISNAIKWTHYPKEILPMWVADMDFSAPPPILSALRKFVDYGDLGYPLAPQSLYETIAARMDKLYNWKISPEMIVPISGVNSGYNVAVRTFCTSRKGYLIQTPVYNEFHETQRKTGMLQVEAPLAKSIEENRIRYETDFDSLKRGVKK